MQQIDSQTGRENWSHGCEDLTGDQDCQDSIEADFSVSSSDNVLYYGNVDGMIVALQVGSFPTPAQVSPQPTSTPTDVEPLAPDSSPVPTVSPTNGGGFNSPVNNGNVSASTKSPSSGLNDTTTKALFAVSGLIAALAIAILTYVFLSVKRRRQRKRSGLPVTKQLNENNGRGDGGAETGIPAESSLETIGGSMKRKKKKRSVSMTSEPCSPSRLGAIDESSLEDASLEEGHELSQDDEDDDIENYVFDYTETTPDTSFSSSPSSSPERVTQSRDVPFATSTAADHTVISPSLVAVAEEAAPPADGAYRFASPATEDEDDHSSTDDEDLDDHLHRTERELIPVASDGPRPYYMLDTRPEGAGSIIKVGNRSKIPNESQQVNTAPFTTGTKSESSNDVAGRRAMVSANLGARSSYALDYRISATPLSVPQSMVASAPNTIHEKRMGLPGTMVPLSKSGNHSAYEVGPPDVGGMVTPYDRSNARASSTIHARDDHHNQETAEPISKEHLQHLQKLWSAKSDSTKTLASIDEDGTPTKQNALVPVSEPRSAYVIGSEREYGFDDQLSPCTSMYFDEESTVATGATGEGTLESAPLDEKASRSYIARSKLIPAPQRMHVDAPVGSASALRSTPKRRNVSSSPVSPSSARLDAISPLTVEKSDTQPTARKMSPSYIINAPLSPGSTIGSTSIYIDDEGSVEMEADDHSNASVPIDEKYTAPSSVALDACLTPKKNEDMELRPTEEIKKVAARKTYGTSKKTRSSTQEGKPSLSAAPKLSPPPPLSPTSTITNESRSSVESVNELGRSPAETSETIRQMRKMRLERTIRGWKADGARSQKEEASTSMKQRDSADGAHSQKARATLSVNQTRSQKKRTTSVKQKNSTGIKDRMEAPMRPSVPIKRLSQNTAATHSIPNDGQSHTTGDDTIAPSIPTLYSTKSAVFTSSDSDTSSEKRPLPPVKKKSYSRHEQPRRSTSTSTARKKHVERKEKAEHGATSRKSERIRQSKPERKGSVQPPVIASYLSGIIKHVEEAEHKFFNPTLTPTKSKKTASQKMDSSDDDSMSPPPPPPSY